MKAKFIEVPTQGSYFDSAKELINTSLITTAYLTEKEDDVHYFGGVSKKVIKHRLTISFAGTEDPLRLEGDAALVVWEKLCGLD